MKYRKLRIAWSVIWGILCLLLIALWVRSYWITDRLSHTRSTGYVGIYTFTGIVEIHLYSWPIGNAGNAEELNNIGFELVSSTVKSKFGKKPLAWFRRPEGPIFTVPVWCVESVLLLLASLPWLRWRFSLRTLLIGMTLVAVALGAFVFFMR